MQIETDDNGRKIYLIVIRQLDRFYPQESASAQHLAAQMAVDLGADEAKLALITDSAAVI